MIIGLDGRCGKQEHCGNEPVAREYTLGNYHLSALWFLVIPVPQRCSLMQRKCAPESRQSNGKLILVSFVVGTMQAHLKGQLYALPRIVPTL
ncbi:Extracellular endo-alpha-(1-_5)-L-arabinanase 1 [Fusarium oxysporum f. sp. albedinis]|nr:Extracellular endo-alpha-(1->5)-L-arabinanase 1 [Fusarium oxysporum f. sp. albedinis]